MSKFENVLFRVVRIWPKESLSNEIRAHSMPYHNKSHGDGLSTRRLMIQKKKKKKLRVTTIYFLPLYILEPTRFMVTNSINADSLYNYQEN